jgi:hypothetical protein
MHNLNYAPAILGTKLKRNYIRVYANKKVEYPIIILLNTLAMDMSQHCSL